MLTIKGPLLFWAVMILVAILHRTTASTLPQPSLSSVRNCCVGREVLIGLAGGDYAPWVAFENGAVAMGTILSPDEGVVIGYLPAVIDELAKEMGITYKYYILASGFEAQMQGFQLLSNGTIDTFPVFGLNHDSYTSRGYALGVKYAYSHNMYAAPFSGLVKRTPKAPSPFRFLEPFTLELWLAIVVFLLVVALLLVVIQILLPLDSKNFGMSREEVVAHERLASGDAWSFWPAYMHSAYHAFAAYLQGDDYEYTSPAERVLRLGMLSLVLIVVSTYTANLAAFFTQPAWTIHGPQTMADLRSATACSTTAADLYAPDGTLLSKSALRPFVGDLVQPSVECLAWAKCGREYCREALQSGRADIWLDDKNALHTYQMQELDKCTQMASTPGIDGFLPSYSSATLAFRASDWPFAANFSEATLHYEMQPSSYQLMGSTFATDQQCDTRSTAGATTAIQFKDMQGLFVLCTITAGLSLLVALCQRCTVDKGVENLNPKLNCEQSACQLEQSSPHPVWEIKGGEVVCNAVDINTTLDLGMVGNTSSQATILSELGPDQN